MNKKIPKVERPLIWVEKGSLEYQLFLQRLDDNLDEKTRRLVCIPCWSFISQPERQYHLEHKDYILAPHFIKDEFAFLQTANEY